MDTGHSMWPRPFTSWPWPWIFQGQIFTLIIYLNPEYLILWMCLKNCWSDWYEMKRKQFNWILCQLYGLAFWPHPWPWPWIFKVKLWNILILGMGGLIDMEWYGLESIIYDLDLLVTMVFSVHAQDTDQGDLIQMPAYHRHMWFALEHCSVNQHCCLYCLTSIHTSDILTFSHCGLLIWLLAIFPDIHNSWLVNFLCFLSLFPKLCLCACTMM